MPPQLLSLICFGLQELITHEPEIAAEIKALFTKSDPTKEDWQKLHDKVSKRYCDYVPASQLSAPQPALLEGAVPTGAESQPPAPAESTASAPAQSQDAAESQPAKRLLFPPEHGHGLEPETETQNAA